ncbi:hypothetical protein D049_1770A, partial [Vibrio parahaemolyticus VPTS-2010]
MLSPHGYTPKHSSLN